MNKLSFKSHRIISGIALLVFLFCAINFCFDFHIFGSFNKELLAVCGILMALYLRFCGPTLSDIKDYRDAKGKLAHTENETTRENV